MLKIRKLEKKIPVYDITVNTNHNFYANDILVHNCSEIFLPTTPMMFDGLRKTEFENISDYNADNGMISLCILGCINFGKLSNITRLDSLTSIFVRFLDNLIDEQDYPMDAAEWPTKGYRFLGIGISDFAHFLAKHDARLGTQKSKDLTHRWAERFQYGLIKASNQLAKERGACEFYDQLKYSDGVLPIDLYNKNVDKIINNKLLCDWEGLRADIKTYGIRNATLSAIPPTASSSLVSNSTQGIDPIFTTTDTYESASYVVKSIVPDFEKENYYMKAWDMAGNNNSDYMKLMAILQKFICQGMSTNQYYDLTKLPNRTLDANRVKKDILIAFKYGLKSLYYIRTKDKENISEEIKDDTTPPALGNFIGFRNEADEESPNMGGCAGGGCSI